MKYLNVRHVVFHAYDSFTKTPGWTAELENLLARSIERADLIIASSDAIARGLSIVNDQRVRILHNGVDEKLFKPQTALPCPSDLSMIPRPWIGYIGTVNEKFDIELVGKIATQRSDWHWVIIGRQMGNHGEENFGGAEIEASWKLVRTLSNVHFLGLKDFRELPAYASNIDVNTMCYRVDKIGWWRAGDPLKCYEYLAVTKPIVSANIENVRRFSKVIDIASTPSEWIAAIERALTSGGVGTREQRRAVALQNTWDKRVDQLEEWLFEMIRSS